MSFYFLYATSYKLKFSSNAFLVQFKKWSTDLYGLLLVNAEAVHESEHLLTVLTQSCFTVAGQALSVKYGALGRDLPHHPAVLFDLTQGQAPGWI